MQVEAEDPVPIERLLMFHMGVLSEADHKLMAERIDGDPRARATLAEWRRQDASIASLYAPIAEEALPQEYKEMFEAARASPVRAPFVMPRIGVFAAALAFLVLGTAVGWGIHELLLPTGSATTTGAARAFSTYGVETAHPVEVPASDSRHLIDWVASRLGTRVQPPDLSRAGFALLGGRVLPAAGGPAALFLYQNAAGERVGLYVASRGDSVTTGSQYFDTEGVEGYWWLDHGTAFALAGKLSRDRLRRIASMAYDQLL